MPRSAGRAMLSVRAQHDVPPWTALAGPSAHLVTAGMRLPLSQRSSHCAALRMRRDSGNNLWSAGCDSLFGRTERLHFQVLALFIERRF